MTVAKAKREGLLPSARGLTCVDCSAPAVDYDHRDYNQPLRVEPVCRRCNLKRGPGIPRVGDLSNAVARGYRPYFSRRSVARILGLLELPLTVLDNVPSTLQMEHWQQLAPVIEAGVAAYCARLNGGESHEPQSPFFAPLSFSTLRNKVVPHDPACHPH